MRISYGNAGWVRVEGVGLPGPLYLRLGADAAGRWGITEFYADGAEQLLTSTLLRQLRLDLIQAAALEEPDHLKSPTSDAGPDLRRLAAHYATNWGPTIYDGGHCDRCGGPVKGGSFRRRAGRMEAMQNWVAESHYAQFDDQAFPNFPTRVEQVPVPKERPTPVETEELPRLRPPAGRRMTDEFLRDVTLSYAIAARRGIPPAPAIAAVAGVSPRAVHKWIYTARKRGFMPPGVRGRVG